MEAMKMVMCVFFVLVLAADFVIAVDKRKPLPSEMIIRAAMVVIFPFLLEWF